MSKKMIRDENCEAQFKYWVEKMEEKEKKEKVAKLVMKSKVRKNRRREIFKGGFNNNTTSSREKLERAISIGASFEICKRCGKIFNIGSICMCGGEKNENNNNG